MQEENAIDEVFRDLGTTILLCDFHVKQAWWRNINKADMGVLAVRKKPVLGDLCALAAAETLDIFNAKLAIFKGSDDYTRNAKLRSYLETHWWNCTELWAACYRRQFHGGINTNNHQEALNRALKHGWLNDRVSRGGMILEWLYQMKSMITS